MRIDHAALRARSVERSAEFYRKYTGARIVHERTDGAVRVCWARIGAGGRGFKLVLIEGLETGAAGDAGLDHFGIHVRDRAEVDRIAAMAERDGALAQPARHRGRYMGYSCIVTDPDGTRLEFACEQAEENDGTRIEEEGAE